MSERSLLVGYVDVTGRLRVRLLPPDERARAYTDGVTYNRANLNLDVFERLPDDPVLPSIAGEYAVVGEASSERRYPSGAPFDVTFGYLTDTGGLRWPSACPRSALARAVDRLDRLGLHALVGFEPEGYLLAGDGVPVGQRHFSSAASLVALEPFLSQVVEWCTESGIRLTQSSKELGPGQFEVNLPPGDPMDAADDLVIVQEACRNAARGLGMRASFMPCIADGQPSSGAHVHLSLHASDENALGSRPTELTGVGRSAIAGLLGSASALSLVAMPTVTSYKRLTPGAWVPVLVAWSLTSRDALIRVVGAGSSLRVENRGVDGCANPHLLVAAILHAVAEGVESSAALDDRLHIDRDVDSDRERAWTAAGLPTMPRNLGEAIDAFESDQALRAALGSVTSDLLVQVKRQEWASFLGAVSEWDRATYLDLF